MKINILMILICVIALVAIAFRMGFLMYHHPEPLQTYDPSFITYHGSLWSPPIVTSTPQQNIWSVSVPVKQVQQNSTVPLQATKACYKLQDQITYCQ
jgi:hypothetical protein